MKRSKKKGFRQPAFRKPRRLTGDRELVWRVTNLKIWRKHRGWVQKDVADRLGALDPILTTTRNTVQRWENGLQLPSIAAIEGLARVFDTTVHSLLNRMPDEADLYTAFEGLTPEQQRAVLDLLHAFQGDRSAQP